MNAKVREGALDDDVAARAKTTEENFWRRSGEWRKDLKDMRRSLIDQLQWFRFEHEAKKFLVRFSFKNDGFAIKPIVKQDFVWCEFSEAFLSEDETIVDVSDMADEQVVVGKKLMEGDGPNLFTDGDDHQT